MDNNHVCPICLSYMSDSLEHPGYLKCSCGFSKPVKEFITMDDYWKDPSTGENRAELYADELTVEIRHAAAKLLSRVNGLLGVLEQSRGYTFDDEIKLSSGWRPPSVNALIPNASKKSGHCLGIALDIRGHIIYELITANPKLLHEFDLWMEDKTDATTWTHLDIRSRTEREVRIFHA